MKTIQMIGRALLLVVVGCVMTHASDRVAVYARVDKVVLEPNAGSPERIQVWGVFSLAKPNDRNDYLPAARGFLYFKLPADNQENARREWADLKEVAGTGQIVALGSRSELKARLRKPKEQPENADPYPVNVGVTRVRGNTEYPPIRAILDYKD